MKAPAYKTQNSRKSSTPAQDLAVTAIFTALTYIFTWLINIRLPLAGSGGLIHLGNVPLFIGAVLYGRRTGAFAGAFGMGLFDLMSGWTLWAPFTFVIVGFMGFTVGIFAEKRPFKNFYLNTGISFFLALLIKVAGYYLAEVILYGNWLTPLGSIPGNTLQVGFAAAVVLLLLPQIRRIPIIRQMTKTQNMVSHS